MKLLILSVLAVAALAEKLPSSGGYHYVKPQGQRLELPLNQFGAPFNQQQRLTTRFPFTTTTFNKEYLPPTTTEVTFTTEYPEDAPAEDPLLVQGLPKQDPQAARFTLSDFKSNFFAQQHQLKFGPVNGQLRASFGGARLEQAQPQPQQQSPNQEYGPPNQQGQNEETEPVDDEEEEVQDVPESRNAPERDGESEENVGGSTIAVANAGSTGSGQYYILAPDNSLQKVMFVTLQSEDDKRTQGFTAQLRYSPVEPIKDPVYGFNEQGQLVRVFKK